MIDKHSPVPLYLQIQNLLMEQIRSGEVQPGRQVASEPEIAARYHISRMTARKALDGLVTKGILYRHKGKGTFVSENVMSYGLSTMLSFSKTFTAQGYAISTVVLRKDVVPGAPGVTQALDLPPEHPLVLIERLRLLDGRPAALHTSYLDQQAFAPILALDLTTDSVLDAIERISGARIAYTRDAVRAALATRDHARLLEIEPGAPVLHVEGVAFLDHDQPVRFTRAVYRADMFQLVVTNTAELADSLRIAEPALGAL